MLRRGGGRGKGGEKKRLYRKTNNQKTALLFYTTLEHSTTAQYNGHIKLIKMIKKFDTDHISGLRQEKKQKTKNTTFYIFLLLSTTMNPGENT